MGTGSVGDAGCRERYWVSDWRQRWRRLSGVLLGLLSQ